MADVTCPVTQMLGGALGHRMSNISGFLKIERWELLGHIGTSHDSSLRTVWGNRGHA